MASAAELSQIVQRLETVACKLESAVLGSKGSTAMQQGNTFFTYLDLFMMCSDLLFHKKRIAYSKIEVTLDIWCRRLSFVLISRTVRRVILVRRLSFLLD